MLRSNRDFCVRYMCTWCDYVRGFCFCEQRATPVDYWGLLVLHLVFSVVLCCWRSWRRSQNMQMVAYLSFLNFGWLKSYLLCLKPLLFNAICSLIRLQGICCYLWQVCIFQLLSDFFQLSRPLTSNGNNVFLCIAKRCSIQIRSAVIKI